MTAPVLIEARAATSEALPFAVRRFGLVVVVSVGALVLIVLASLTRGSVEVRPGEALDALLGRPASRVHHLVVMDLRLPRALVALVAGGCLGLAGALSQAVTRNPLASPDLTGVAAGVVLVTVLWIAFGPAWTTTPAALLLSPTVVIVGAVGGAGSGALVYALAARRRSDPVRLVLTGVVVSLILQTATAFVLMLRGDNATLGAYFWFIGSLNARAWPHWAVLWPWALFLVVLSLGGASRANILQLGDDVAGSLGLSVEAARRGLFLVSAVLTAGALVVVGAIGFIGLMAPHIARRLVGSDMRRVLPLTFLVGAVLLSGADLAGRSVTSRPVPTGVITAVVGAAFFLVLLARGDA